MAIVIPKTAPRAPVFTVEVIDEEGFAWLFGPVDLNEALRISSYFAMNAARGKEPRISIPARLLRRGLTDE